MADVFKIVGGLFGIGGDEATGEPSAPKIDPADERRALAELGAAEAEEHSEIMHLDAKRLGSAAINRDGSINFEVLYSDAGIEPASFSADHAIKIIANVEQTLPATLTTIDQRDTMLRQLVLATADEPVAPAVIVNDALKKSTFLTAFTRSRLDAAAQTKLKAADRIKMLEQQIAAANVTIAKADAQFAAISKSCKEKRELYARVVALFSEVRGAELSDHPTNNSGSD